MIEKVSGQKPGESKPGMSFFNEKRTLEFRIGEGFISSYEARTLEPGDIVRTNAMAGRPGSLFYGGNFFGQAETLVIGGETRRTSFGARLLKLEPAARKAPYPDRGIDAVELLPFSIVLARAEYALSELSGSGPESVIDMGKPYETDEDAELVAGGIPLASGKIVVQGESMGIRIRRILAEATGDFEVRISGSVLKGRGEAGAKDYDFKRPDKYTSQAILSLREIHSAFLRLLEDLIPDFSGFRLSFVDQMTYSEWHTDASRPSDLFLLSGMGQSAFPEGRRGEPMREIPKKLLVECGESEYHFKKSIEDEIRKWISYKTGTELETGARLSSNILFAFRGIGGDAVGKGGAEVLECLRSGWRLASSPRFTEIGISTALPEDLAFDPDEMILLVRCENPEAPGACFDTVYPDHAIGKFVSDLEIYGE